MRPRAAAQRASVVPPECETPRPNRLLRHGDTSFSEEIFDISETQAEMVAQPDPVTDDVRGTSVSAIAGRLARHRPTLPPTAST